MAGTHLATAMDGGYDFLSTTPLPPSVESLLHQICSDQRQPPPEDGVRRTLSQLGEEISLQILNKISKSTIKKSLSGYILFMANKYKNSPDVVDASGGSARVYIPESASPSPRAFSTKLFTLNALDCMIQLLKDFKVSEPWSRIYSTPCKPEKKKPSEMSADELEKELFNLFLRTRFQKSNCMGVAADSWIAIMDRLLTLGESCADEKNQMKRSMHELVDVYYDALDAPKSGKQVVIRDELIVRRFPHYMEREPKFTSTSILGLLYDKVESYQYVDPATCGEDIWKLPCFDIEIPSACMELWRKRYKMYGPEMFAALRSPEKETKDVAANGVTQRYKQLLYGAPEFEASPRNPKDIYNEAIAIYHVCYNKAIQMDNAKSCLFAWKVAGPALSKFYAYRHSERSQKLIICLPSVLHELFN